MKWAKTWKLWAIAHENGGRKHENHEFLRCLSNQLSVVTVARNRPRNQKMCVIAHEMGKRNETVSSSPRKWRLKTWKIRVFAMPLKPSIGAYGSWKLSQKPENVRYSPWNGQKTWNFWAITHGNGGRKHEKHEFLRCLSNQVSVVTVAGNCPGNRKMCAIAHEMGKNMKTVSYSPWNGQKAWNCQL